MHARRAARRSLVLLVCFLLGLAPLLAGPEPPVARAADPAPPEFLRDHPDLRGRMAAGDAWTIGSGFLYWGFCNQVDSGGGYLRRWPLRGGRVITLRSSSFCADGWAADASGLYYWRGGNIVRGTVVQGIPGTPGGMIERALAPSPRPSGPIILNHGVSFWPDYIFWLANDTLYSAHRETGARLAAPEPLGAGAHSLRFAADGYFYWFANGALYRGLKVCLAVGGGNCIKEVVAAENGDNFTDATLTGPQLGSSTYPLWTNGGSIRGVWCREQGLGRVCSPSASYTAPAGSEVGAPASDGQFLFWVENRRDCTGGGFCVWSDSGRLMKWRLRKSFFGPGDFDTPQQIACKNCFASYTLNSLPGQVLAADGWVYFDTSNGPSRLRADAAPISVDLAADGMEVTQGIQNLSNDVPLAADRPTYVRLYGRKLSGPNAYSVGALLYGTRSNGASLPGSPLRPLNGGQDFTAANADPNRGVLTGSWLFQLPPAWSAAGAITLRAQVDPEGVWGDLNPHNNALGARSFSFTAKAPICLVTIPVRTHAPPARHDDPGLLRMIDMLRQLMPASDVWLYHQTTDVAQLEGRIGIPPWKYEPYALPGDGSNVLRSLWLREQLTDDPDRCDDAGAITHYLGLVHAQTPTGPANREHLGRANTPGSTLYVKLVPPGVLASTTQDWRDQRFNTLAHELGHNYGRLHVNCGGPSNTDPGYPYRDAQGTSCVLDDGLRGGAPIAAHQRYYGFDTRTLTPIDPAATADFMAYRQPYWVSDYTWRGLFSRVRNAALAAEAPAAPAAGGVVYITGGVDPAAGSGSLDYAWSFPAGALSEGMRVKLAGSLASEGSAALQSDGAYRLRLRDAGGSLLDERVVSLDEAEDGEVGAQSFALTLPAPAGQVARLELLSGERVLAALEPGGAAPELTLLSPAGGETVGDELTLSWRASDPDAEPLLFAVQYSPDSGLSWRTLLANLPGRTAGDTVTLRLSDLSGLPASTTGGLIRVAASDGYNTTLATSAPFTVLNRAPLPYISAPGGAPIAAGQPVLLQGGAGDPEDGAVGQAALSWSLDGQPLGDGAQLWLDGLAPGSYALALTARDTAGAEATATATLTVAPLQIPQGGEPTLDGSCDDGAYAGAAQVPLPAYADGSRAHARLVRGGDALWACFVGMRRTGGGSPGTQAALRVDTTYGRAAQPQASDYVFTLGEDGVATTYQGDGAGYSARGPAGLGGQVSASGGLWMAELRIDAATLGGWGHPVGLSLEQVDVGAAGDNYLWPGGTVWNRPATWAAAVLGDAAGLSGVAPDSAPLGAGDTPVTLTGSGFVEGATAMLDGAPLATTFVSATELAATIPAASLAAAGERRIAVANPGLAAAPSGSVGFSVLNPAPRISALALEDRTLTVRGSGFVAGASVIWDGVEHEATLADAGLLLVSLGESDPATFGETEVTVFNPGPGGGVSNVATLSGGRGAGAAVYLPLLRR